MARFSLKDSDEYYLSLSEQPKRFDADSPVTNVFFDDTNGQVFTVRSGGVTGVTVNGMDDKKCTSFRMEDKGPIISIKFSPDHKILAIQRNLEGQNATVEFANFKDLVPTNVEYSHTCKWKNAKILGFVWPRVNEIAFITDHGIELLQVLPDKKQLKTIKSTGFSGAWFSWCAQSNIILLAGNNGALLQPFSLNNSTITKLQKLEVEWSRPVMERDVFVLRLCGAAWCAVFRHAAAAPTVSGPTEVWLMPISGGGGAQHVLKTGLMGRFAVSVIDHLLVIHHQSSQTSQIFDIMEESKPENNVVIHIPIVQGVSMKPAMVDDQLCPMYSGNWVVFQPDYIIDARLGCLWQVRLLPAGLAHQVLKDEVPKIVAVLLRRKNGKDTIYRILNQLVTDAGDYLVELAKSFDEINSVYRKWAELEVARNTAGQSVDSSKLSAHFPVLIAQADVCTRVLQAHADDQHLVQVVTAYLASLSRHDMVVQHPVAELCVRTLVTRNACGRLRSLVRRGCLGDAKPLACQLLSLGHIDPAAAQIALDMMWRLKAYGDVVEVLLSWDEPLGAAGAARQAGAAWLAMAPRKLLAAAMTHAQTRGRPAAFLAVYHALLARNERTRGSPHFLKTEQCDIYIDYYKQLTSES
ncbi:regulator of MON1-CCZ1 complex [Pararge aegeria]|nr:regulator of MON1-CCZ1 complex [Pararge aegeria]XP_039755417.1 regulator of MON1-CCZ1 complex [Pararge aegeria]